MANYVNDTNLTLETIFCDDFLAREAPLALSLARLENPDANLGYNHVEFLIPSNTAQQRCETCPLTGGCDWGGLGSWQLQSEWQWGDAHSDGSSLAWANAFKGWNHMG